MSSEHYIEDANLSLAWLRAVRLASARGQSEVAPLVVSVTGFDADHFEEDQGIRTALDKLLIAQGKQSIETVANTIFPISLWNPHLPRQSLFERYAQVVPRLRRASRKNSRGLYFERMISAGPKGKENQLDFAISTSTARRGVRRSILQLAIFDPNRDHSAAAQLGFPCLQHVTFAPTAEGLQVNAFYATQYLVERAYGNYVGLCRLGRFAAHEMGLPLRRFTCFTGVAQCEMPKSTLRDVLRQRDASPSADEQEEQ